MNTQASAAPGAAGIATGATRAWSGNAGLLRAAWALVFLLAFLGFDQISSIGPAPPLVLTPWNPALGLCVAVVMRRRAAMLPFVFLGPLLSQLIAPDLPQATLYGAWIGIVALAETAAVVAGSQWLMKAVSNPLLKNELSAILLSSLPVAFIGAVMRSGFLVVIGYASAYQFGEGVLRFWVGDVIGIFIIAPLCLLALSLRRPRAFDLRRSIEIALQAAIVLGAVWLAFGENPQTASRYFYAVFLPMIWIVLRFGVNGAIVMNAFVQISMVVSLSWAGHDKVDVTLFQAILLVLAASSLTLGLAVDQSRLATQRLRARENELSASLKISATGELAGALAHEMGHPLGAISNYAAALNHVLARIAPEESEGRTIAGKLSREIVRATDTLHRLRDFFRTGSLVVERVDLTTLLREAVSMLDDRFERCHIKPHILIQSGLNRLQADRIQIHAVIHNLLINAIDTLLLVPAEARALSIVLSRTGQDVVLEIDDSGVGVASDVRDHIFEPLTTTKKNGLGLGLSMCRSIVAAHGGNISLGNSRLGGAKFVVTLPIDAI